MHSSGYFDDYGDIVSTYQCLVCRQSHKLGTICDHNHIAGSYIEQIVEAWKGAWKEYAHSVDAIPNMGIMASHDRYWSPYPESNVNWMGQIPGCLSCGANVKGNALTCEACDAEATKKLYGPKNCECGAEKANEGRPTIGHSNWCPKGNK